MMNHKRFQPLVIGVSTRALYNLEEENRIYEQYGIEAYRRYQMQQEEKILEPGTAFALIRNLLNLNKKTDVIVVEVVVMSRNSAETGLRILNSIKHHELAITSMAFSGGEPIAPYMKSFGIDLFLSKDEQDVQHVIDADYCAAAIICNPPQTFMPDYHRVKIAFDADAVLFSDESEYRYKTEGLDAFQKHEADNENVPLNEGPFARLLLKLSAIQSLFLSEIGRSPLRIAIVTARSAPSHLRVIRTLRKWGVYVDEVYFMGGLAKDNVLEVFGAQLFVDDQDMHLQRSAGKVPSGKVPYTTASPMNRIIKC